MSRVKTYKYRLYPTKKQAQKPSWTLDICRILYNSCLLDRRNHYEQTGKGLLRVRQQEILKSDKEKMESLSKVHSQVLQDFLFRVDRAFHGFFRRLKERNCQAGYPRFKGENRYDSITYPQEPGFQITTQRLKLFRIGTIKIKMHRPVVGEIKNGKVIDNPEYLVKTEKKLQSKQRELSRKKKGSSNRKKARKVVARIHCQVRNQRSDLHHKISRRIIVTYGFVAVEDLNIQGMVRKVGKHHLTKHISDAGWGQFLRYLTYKAEEAGCKVEKVAPHYTSINCSVCGKDVPKTLAQRTHSCPYCWTVLDRDYNAAQNILLKATAGTAGSYAWGEAVHQCPSLNQEA